MTPCTSHGALQPQRALPALEARATDPGPMAHEREETTAMLTSARRREQRARFGALLTAARAPEDHAQGNDARGFSEDNVRAAGAFGVLEPDAVALLFDRVLRAGHDVSHSAAVANRADRVGPAVHARIRNAAADVYALAKTCKYMTACFGYNGNPIRLETAAVVCTSLAPTHRASGHVNTPVLDQFMQEQRSRFDLQMLESALVSMVTHCTADHCRAMRRVHNARIGRQVSARLEHDVLLRRTLNDQTPIVRVVHTSNKEMWTPLDGLDARIDQAECVVATVEGEKINLACLRDESPLELCPNSELRRVWKVAVPAPLASTPSDWRVKTIALSSCGQWVALVRYRPPHANDFLAHEHVLTVWNTSRPTEPCGSFRLQRTSIQTLWFRQVEVAAQHAVDGEHRPKATIVCFCATSRIPPPLWRNQLNHWYPGAHPIGLTKVYQYCVEDGSLPDNVDATLPDWHGLVLKPAGHRLDTTYDATLDEHWWSGATKGEMEVFEEGISDETSLVSISLTNECPDSIGVCLFGLVDVRHSTHGPVGVPTQLAYRSLAVQQCVVLDLSYEHRHGDSTPLLRPTLSMQSVTGHAPPLQKLVQLSPRGDLVVVLVQSSRAVANHLWSHTGYEVQILGRRGNATHFVPLACLDLNRSVHRFRTERALVAALANSDEGPRPEGCVRIRSPPISRAFSPCGRFLLYGFAEGVRFSRSEESPQAHMEPPLHADGGMCVFDLSDIWEPRVGEAPTAAVAWIECKADVVPMRMRWTTAGLWLTTRRGPLLLGTTKPATDKPGSARS